MTKFERALTNSITRCRWQPSIPGRGPEIFCRAHIQRDSGKARDRWFVTSSFFIVSC